MIMTDNQGKLIIICAPSGSGKTTIIKAVLNELKNLEFSVSATSRPSRQGEVDGKDYYFLSEDDFRKKIENGDFLEWEEVYKGSFYGTLKSELKRIWEKNSHVIFDVDVLGGLSIKKQFPHNSLAVFIQPPSVEELKHRLFGRGTETLETIAKRVERAEYEIGFANQFDVQIINDDLQTAIDATLQSISRFLL
jgi:guanylate kinase